MAINFCINCGEKLEEGASVCAACGEAVPVLAEPADEAEEQAAEATDKKNAEASEDHAAEAAEDKGLDIAEPKEAEEGQDPDIDEPGDAKKGQDPDIDEPKDAEKGAEKPAEPEEDFSTFADFTGFDIITSDPGAAPAERIIAPPDRTDVMAPIGGMRNAHEYRAPQAEKSYTGIVLKIAAGVAAALLVVAAIGLLAQDETRQNIQEKIEAANSVQNASASAGGQDQTSSDAVSEGTEGDGGEGANSSGVKSSISVSDSAANLDDDTAFEYLTQVYDSLQSYNDRVYSCIQTYNGVFVTPDRGQREAAAGIASSLLSEIESDIKSLDSMNIGRASSLYDDYENVRRLLNDQYQRLAVIVESYDISLKYDTPYQHQDEILEPLTRDIGPTGENKYLEDFDATYWSSRPTR